MARVEVFYSLQSDYCYFLLDRLIGLSGQLTVQIRPVLGGVLRLPERYRDRDEIEQRYFELDTRRTAQYLGLPYAYPEPSPIDFKPGSLWVAEDRQPRNELIHRLYTGSVEAGKVLQFLDKVGRMLWDGSTRGWDRGDHLANAMIAAGLDLNRVLDAMSCERAGSLLKKNANAMLDYGHWGVPLVVYDREPFYGQDRFEQLLWRLGKLPRETQG